VKVFSFILFSTLTDRHFVPYPDEVVWNEDDEGSGDEEEEEEMEDGDSDDDEDAEGSGDEEDGEGSGDEESVEGSEQDGEEDEDEDEEEEEDGESEGEWVDVSDDEEGEGSGSDDGEEEDGSDDEGAEEEKGSGKRKRDDSEAEPQNAQQRSKKLNSIRGRVDARRVLTEADFALLEKLRAAQAERLLDPRNRSRKSGLLGADSSAALKRKREEDDIEEGAAATAAYSVDASALAPGTRAEKTSKIDRIMHVLDGRKDAKRFEHEGHAGGLTNKEKLRKKNFVMVRKGKRAVTHKLRKSNSQTRHDKKEAVRLTLRYPCAVYVSLPSRYFVACVATERDPGQRQEEAQKNLSVRRYCLGVALIAGRLVVFCVYNQCGKRYSSQNFSYKFDYDNNRFTNACGSEAVREGRL
jgi:hypothetical protein